MADWSAQREALQQLQESIQSRLERTGQYGLDDPLRDELGELSLYDNHPGDIGDELFERGKDLALRDADKLRLQEIDRAMKSMDDGTYGTCVECGQPISTERLEVYPMTTMCVACKKQDEREHPDRSRPIEEEFLWPGYGRTDTDNTEAVAFDGEDSWQAVGRYNQRTDYENDYEQVEFDDNEGIVDPADRITNEQYWEQLP